MKIWFSFFVLFMITFMLNGQSVTISGTASGAEGKMIRFYQTSDRITLIEKEIAETRIDGAAKFSATVDVKSTGLIKISIDLHEAEIFVIPANTYEIRIDPLDYKSNAEINPFIESQNLTIEFVREDPLRLNSSIIKFDSAYNDFVLKNFNNLYRAHNISILNDFKEKVTREFPDSTDQYFKDYMKYKIGSLEQVSKAMSPSQLMRVYFSDKPILYENVEYMDFFKLFFSKYMTAVSRQIKFTDYNSILTKAGSYPNMLKAMQADTSLKRMDLRELVMLYGVWEMYGDPAYSNSAILSLLKDVASGSKFAEHRIIAADMTEALTKLKPGTDAPRFTLRDRNGKMVSLSDFSGKPVVLSFWTVYCQECLNQMELLKPVADKYHDKMAFVSISADKEFDKMTFFLGMKKDFSWTFLHIGESIDVLKEYNVKSYPLFLLIDKDGKILRFPASSPGEGLEAEIESIVNL